MIKKNLKTIVIVVMSMLCILSAFFFTGCDSKKDYTAYTLAEYRTEDYASKKVQYQFLKSSSAEGIAANMYDFIGFMYTDGAWVGVETPNTSTWNKSTTKAVYYYGYWTENEDGTLTIKQWFDNDDTSGLIVYEEEYTCTVSGNGWTCDTYFVRYMSAPSMGTTMPIVSDGETVTYATVDAFLEYLEANAVSTDS